MLGKGLGTEALGYMSSSVYLDGLSLESTTEINSVTAYEVDVYLGDSSLESLTELNTPFWFYYGSENYDPLRTVLVQKFPLRTLLVQRPLDRTCLVPKAEERKVRV